MEKNLKRHNYRIKDNGEYKLFYVKFINDIKLLVCDGIRKGYEVP